MRARWLCLSATFYSVDNAYVDLFLLNTSQDLSCQGSDQPRGPQTSNLGNCLFEAIEDDFPSIMEALTALGLATNVVQFVDFASKIVSQAVKIYRAQGTQDESNEHLTLEKLTSSFQSYNKALKSSLRHQESEASNLSVADKEILEICGQCEGLTRKLLTTLSELRSSKTNVWTSFVDALKIVWSDDEVQKLRQTLDSYRQQIALLMMVSVR
jgi:hypothetical protein